MITEFMFGNSIPLNLPSLVHLDDLFASFYHHRMGRNREPWMSHGGSWRSYLLLHYLFIFFCFIYLFIFSSDFHRRSRTCVVVRNDTIIGDIGGLSIWKRIWNFVTQDGRKKKNIWNLNSAPYDHIKGRMSIPLHILPVKKWLHFWPQTKISTD